jgi:hypothetical protein
MEAAGPQALAAGVAGGIVVERGIGQDLRANRVQRHCLRRLRQRLDLQEPVKPYPPRGLLASAELGQSDDLVINRLARIRPSRERGVADRQQGCRVAPVPGGAQLQQARVARRARRHRRFQARDFLEPAMFDQQPEHELGRSGSVPGLAGEGERLVDPAEQAKHAGAFEGQPRVGTASCGKCEALDRLVGMPSLEQGTGQRDPRRQLVGRLRDRPARQLDQRARQSVGRRLDAAGGP